MAKDEFSFDAPVPTAEAPQSRGAQAADVIKTSLTLRHPVVAAILVGGKVLPVLVCLYTGLSVHVACEWRALTRMRTG